MIQLKRHLDENESDEEKWKKSRSTFADRKIITCFEDLPNEVYHEIFDYLDGYELFQGFSNLNIRFQSLLTCSSRLLKIKVGSYSEEVTLNQSHIVTSNKHQVVSLELMKWWNYDKTFPPFTFDSSFVRLESLSLENISLDVLIPHLVGLLSLPRLFSLTILHEGYEIEDITDVYQIIFKLPKLKYNKIACDSWDTTISLPFATNDQFSNIEYLSIHHPCTLDELACILSYTPQLCRLSCTEVIDSIGYNVKATLNTIPTLTHVFIERCLAGFHEFQPFISNLSSQLQVLQVTCSENIAYLDADRWEQIISKHLLFLRIFEFKYEDKIDEIFGGTFLYEKIDRFNSSFWVKQKCFFNIEIDMNTNTSSPWNNQIMRYSLSPRRMNQFNSNEYIENERIFDNSTDQNVIEQRTISSTTNSLTIINYNYDDDDDDHDELYINVIGPILQRVNITYLNITCEKIFIGILIRLIEYLPHLSSLTVSSLSMVHPRCLSVEEVTTLRLVANTNKITKVYLQNIKELAEVQFLLDLCAHVEHLELDCEHKSFMKRIVRFILMKNIKSIPNLFSLCFKIPQTIAHIPDRLKRMIDLEQLCENYTIKQIDNKIYLQWSR